VKSKEVWDLNHSPSDKYFETNIILCKGFIRVGVVDPEFPFAGFFPGSGGPGVGYGYHSNGYIYAPQKPGVTFGPKLDVGFTVGIGIHLPTSELFVTINGALIGVAANVTEKMVKPFVGFAGGPNEVRVNMHGPFLYDVAYPHPGENKKPEHPLTIAPPILTEDLIQRLSNARLYGDHKRVVQAYYEEGNFVALEYNLPYDEEEEYNWFLTVDKEHLVALATALETDTDRIVGMLLRKKFTGISTIEGLVKKHDIPYKSWFERTRDKK